VRQKANFESFAFYFLVCYPIPIVFYSLTIFTMRTPVKYTRKQQFLRKGFIFILSFTCGIATTVLAAAVYDATVQSRANTIFNSIQSVAGTLDESDVPSYYNLVRMNISSLIQVLRLVDVKVAAELGLSGTG